MPQPGPLNSILDAIGHTPLIRLAPLESQGGAQLYGKLESQNPAGSVKDRTALAMVKAAEESGELQANATIIEATSGNTGISLAMIAAVRGYSCILVMPEDMSRARRTVLKMYGAEVILTPADQGMAGAVAHAEQLCQSTPGCFMPRQFENRANPAVHEQFTAQEIWDDLEGKLDAFVAGVGTGGTVSGVGQFLRVRDTNIRIVAVEPRASAVLSGAEPGLHGIQGLGAGFVPEVFDREVISQIFTVSDREAERMSERLAREAGIFTGPSAGANVHAAALIAASMKPSQRVVTILCDVGERYIS